MTSSIAIYTIPTLVIFTAGVVFLWAYTLYRKRQQMVIPDTDNQLSEKLVEQMMDAIPYMIFIIDQDSKIKRVLNCNHNNLILPLEETIGTCIYDVIDKRSVDKVKTAIHQAVSTNQVQEAEYSISRFDHTFYLEGRFKPLKDGLIACFERNITELKQTTLDLQEAYEQLRIAFSATSTIPMVWDMKNDIFQLQGKKHWNSNRVYPEKTQ